jgi:hypothetical protein
MKGDEMIVNLTQHKATEEQKKEGVVDLPENYRSQLVKLLTVDELPTKPDLIERARKIRGLFFEYVKSLDWKDVDIDRIGVMIGGAPFLMCPLEEAFGSESIPVFYAFSKRESIEETMDDGSVVKKSVFKHAGLIRAR